MKDLKHFGILGMHWGKRKSGSTGTKRSLITPNSPDHVTAHTLKKKRLSELSNEDIRKVTTRLQLEKQFKDLNPKTISFGQKLVGSLLSKFGPKLVASFLKKYAKVNVDDIFGGDPNATEGQVIDAKLLTD